MRIFKDNFWLNILAWNKDLPIDHSVRTSDYPYLSSDTFRSFADFIIDETRCPFSIDEIVDGSIIYISMPCLQYFFKNYFPFIKKKIILISSYHDLSAPKLYQLFLKESKLAVWFTINIDMHHPKVEPIPLGLPLKYWNFSYFDIFKNIRNQTPVKKTKLLYGNFSLTNNYTRNHLLVLLQKKQQLVYFTPKKTLIEYFSDIAESKFVLSPPGWGIDCFRTWESLLLNSIPVVITSSLDPLYIDLPICIIKNWNDLTEEYLKNSWEEIQTKKFHIDKIFAPYWLNLIKSCQMALSQDSSNFVFDTWCDSYKEKNKELIPVFFN